MAIREDLVASAAKFLQDPSVAASSPESRAAFLKAKNLTPEEVAAALARAGLDTPPSSIVSPPSQPQQPVPYRPQQQQPVPPQFYGQQPPYGWQPPPPPPEAMPRRDWRDWFIMATVVGGVGYGLYSMTKRYVYPLVAPPTPDRLEQDKKAIDDQFERAFSLVEQLAKDTDELKAAEKERTERLDSALTNLEGVISELKTASKRREEDAERLRDDVRGLKDALPKALDTQREVTDGRLREVNTELKGLRTLIGQRMGSGASAPATNGYSAANGTNGVASYLRPSSAAASTSAPSVVSVESEAEKPAEAAPAPVAAPYNTIYTSSAGVTPTPATTSASGSTGLPSSTGRSIPAWQRAMKPNSVPVASSASSPAATATDTPSIT